MTSPRQQRLAGSFGWPRGRAAPRDVRLTEELLRGLGGDSAFVDDVLGDLAQERARKTREEGALPAAWWYLREAVRAVPHLAWYAARYGGLRGQVRVAAALAIVLAIPAFAFVAQLVIAGAPARLVVEGQRGARLEDGLIVNSRRPVQLPLRVFDAKGHALDPALVHYRVVAGDSIGLTASGAVTCTHAGDAMLRATAGSVATSLIVRCRPVRGVKAWRSAQFVAGDSAYTLPFSAVDPEGQPVHLLAGERWVGDTTVARLEGNQLRPLAPGVTRVSTAIGDVEAHTWISVYELVPSLEGLRADQRFVIARVRLARHDSLAWKLPIGLFWLRYHRDSIGAPMPRLRASGKAMCMPELRPGVDWTHCLVRAPGATLHVVDSGSRGPLTGRISLERQVEASAAAEAPAPRPRP